MAGFKFLASNNQRQRERERERERERRNSSFLILFILHLFIPTYFEIILISLSRSHEFIFTNKKKNELYLHLATEEIFQVIMQVSKNTLLKNDSLLKII